MAVDKVYSFEEDKKANRSSKAIKVLTFIIVFAVLIIGIVIGIMLGTNNGIKQAEETIAEMNTVETTTQEPATLIDGKYRTGEYVVKGTSELRLRKEHDVSSEMLISVPENARITVTEVYNNPGSSTETQYWGKTTYLGHEGWIALYYTENAYSSSVVDTLSESTTSGEVTTAAPRLTSFVPGEYTVTADSGLRIRQSYSVESDMVALIPYGTKITITEVQELTATDETLKYWGKVTYMDCTGWISMYYLTDVTEETTVAATETTVAATETTVVTAETTLAQ